MTIAHEALRPLGLAPEQIKLVMNDTAKCPNSGPAGAVSVAVVAAPAPRRGRSVGVLPISRLMPGGSAASANGGARASKFSDADIVTRVLNVSRVPDIASVSRLTIVQRKRNGRNACH